MQKIHFEAVTKSVT